MATGDISNNIRKMRSKLKEIKYSGDFDVNAFVDGLPTAYLPIYHYAFTGYTPAIAKLISDQGIELFGKPDARFIKAVYKILRDLFAYKPTITKEQFFVKGFAERKVIMCTEIIQLIKVKNSQLNPVATKTSMKTSVRPKSTTETKHLPLAVPKTRPESAKISPRAPAKAAPERPPHIVNELKAAPVSHPVRHLSSAMRRVSSSAMRHVSSSARHIQPVRHMAELGQCDDDNDDDDDDEDTSIVEIRASTCDIETEAPTSHTDISSLYQAVETLTAQVMLLAQAQQVTGLAGYQQVTGNAGYQQGSGNTGYQQGAGNAGYQQGAGNAGYQQGTDNCNNVGSQQGVRNAKYQQETGNAEYQQGTGNAEYQQATGNCETDKMLENIVLKLENTTARMLLLENRVAIIEAKMGDIQQTAPTSTCVTGNHIPPTQPNISENPVMHHSALPEDTPGLFTGPGNSFAEELAALSSSQKAHSAVREISNFSLAFSPIRKVTNAGTIMSANEDTFATETEDDARRSSTPTMGGTFAGDNSAYCDISHLQTKDAVSRIHNMIEETNRMMKENTTEDETPTVDITS